METSICDDVRNIHYNNAKEWPASVVRCLKFDPYADETCFLCRTPSLVCNILEENPFAVQASVDTGILVEALQRYHI